MDRMEKPVDAPTNGQGPLQTHPLARTKHTTVHRRPARGSYDRAAAYSILDEALHCVVAVVDDGRPFVMPMVLARWDDRLILHGSRASRLLRRAQDSAVCVTTILVDGLVLARSAMHHSMNYRSVVVLGRAVELVERDEKLEALRRVVDHGFPGRSLASRPPSEAELQATMVVALLIEEASVKVRAGGPLDDDEDLSLPHWAGVIPLRMVGDAPIGDPLHPPPGQAPEVPARYSPRLKGTPAR